MTKVFENAINTVQPDGKAYHTTIPDAYVMSGSDFAELLGMCFSGKEAEAINLAFLFGFVMGNRCTLRRGLKRL